MKYYRQIKGVTFIELLIYVGVFLLITPVLISVSINSVRQQRQHIVEKQSNVDSQFVNTRINNLIASAKRVDTANSLFDTDDGRLTLIMQDDSSVTIQRNASTNKIEIIENSIANPITSDNFNVEALYFEKIIDNLNDPEIVQGITTRLNTMGVDQYSVPQTYTSATNLERGDFDEDGCPDFRDQFPKHPQCCGDDDDDGICNEMDNCVLIYNPFQIDFDDDEIGDECDDDFSTEFNLYQAFNCSTADQLLDLINQDPPLSSAELKQILLSSSPVPPVVLERIIELHPLLTNGHFQQVFLANASMPTEVYEQIAGLGLPSGIEGQIDAAQASDPLAWTGENEQGIVNYNTVTHDTVICGEDPYLSTITLSNPDSELDSEGDRKMDFFTIDVLDGTDAVTVITQTAGGTGTSNLSGEGSSNIDTQGFQVTLESKIGNQYLFTVGAVSNANSLQQIQFEFGCGATVQNPPGSSIYPAPRYVIYCEGGCETNCGDVGTGILTNHLYSDQCYKADLSYPEWCSKWYTFENDNSTSPAYVGGTQSGQETVYWEKTFTTILTQNLLDELKSITITGEVAYQNIAQFFCDTLASECKMDATLVGPQQVELYNWVTETWDSIGVTGTLDSTSDQQTFEILYNGVNLPNYVGGADQRSIRARIQFYWNGSIPPGQSSAPAFMLIDYFTAHLKW